MIPRTVIPPRLRLNFIPITFTKSSFKGSVLPYEGEEQLKSLRNQYRNSHVFRREGKVIQCVALSESSEILGEEREFTIAEDFVLLRYLVQNALIRFLASNRQEFSSIFPTTRIVLKKEDLLAEVLRDRDKASFLFLYPEYEIESRLVVPHDQSVKFGILANFTTTHGIEATIKELVSKGIQVTNKYGMIEGESKDKEPRVGPGYKRLLAGKIQAIEGERVRLTDYRDKDVIPASDCFLEPRHEHLEECLNTLFPGEYEEVQHKKREQIFKVKGARNQLQRVERLKDWFSKSQPIPRNHEISFNIATQLYTPRPGSEAGEYRSLTDAECVLRPGGSITVSWPVDSHIEKNGPYDTESFPTKRPRIAVLYPPRFKGDVEVFMRQFRDGVPNQIKEGRRKPPYTQGFIRKYRLTGCEFDFYPIKESEDSAAYRDASLEVLRRNIHYDLAIVVTREDFHELHGDENPYLVTKSVFMSHGIPVQGVEIETIRLPSRPYVLNNIALASYAKLGGIPWVLSSAPGMTHELIFGIGSSEIQYQRLSQSERVVGITTVFSGDGNYLLSNLSREVPYHKERFEDYQKALLETLKECLDDVKRRYAWQTGDKVRLIFHQSFRKYRDVEAAAVKQFVDEISGFDVEYAFVHVSTTHPWKIFDESSKGVTQWVDNQKKIKGECVPRRGYYIPLGPNAALLTLTGPYQLKDYLQGCPEPILVSMHEESTFSSLDYLVNQIYKLTFMSWRSFFPSTMPVTISYSDLIARLLGKLRPIPNWNPDVISTRLRESRWFL